MSGFGHESPAAKTVEWYTPPWVFEALGLSFDLDPCSPLAGPIPWVPAAAHYTAEVDGLAQQWAGRVWCNPPYGRETAKWLARMAEHGNGVALVFARPDCAWFHRAAATADVILFLRGRVKFVNRAGAKSGDSGAGSILVAWGTDCADALRRMASKGALMECRQASAA